MSTQTHPTVCLPTLAPLRAGKALAPLSPLQAENNAATAKQGQSIAFPRANGFCLQATCNSFVQRIKAGLILERGVSALRVLTPKRGSLLFALLPPPTPNPFSI